MHWTSLRLEVMRARLEAIYVPGLDVACAPDVYKARATDSRVSRSCRLYALYGEQELGLSSRYCSIHGSSSTAALPPSYPLSLDPSFTYTRQPLSSTRRQRSHDQDLLVVLLIFNPPSISTTLPFIYRAPSPIKNATTSATSSGVPSRSNAFPTRILSTASPPFTIPAFVGVSIYPGATQLTLIPLGPSSSARLLLMPMSPNLVVQ